MVELRARTAISGVPDARIEDRVEHVRDQIEYDDEDAERERDRQNDRGVVIRDRGDEQLAHTRHTEDLLGDDRTREHCWYAQRYERHDWDEAVAKHVPDDDLRF